MLMTSRMRMDLWFWLSSIPLHPVGHYVLDGGSIFYCRGKWGTKHLHCFKLMGVRFSCTAKSCIDSVIHCLLPMLHAWPHWPSLTAHAGTFTVFPVKIQSNPSWQRWDSWNRTTLWDGFVNRLGCSHVPAYHDNTLVRLFFFNIHSTMML